MRHLFIIAALAPSTAFAQVVDPAGDILVTASRSEDRVQPPTISIGPNALLDRQPLNAADALRGLAGVSIRPNSRGETIARIRGSEERQVQIFLDGAPLGIPWDARIDLGQLPAGLIGNITVQKGAVPIEYGVNAVVGAVDFQTRRAVGEDTGNFTGLIQAGTLGYAQGAAVTSITSGRFEATLAGGFVTRDAEPVADAASLPFSQAPSKRRTNSKLDSFSGFTSLGYNGDRFTARASVLHINSTRGIAPESDRNPATSSPRYWRYPDWRLTQLTLSGEAQIGEQAKLKFVGWRQWFDQTIDAYRDISYTTLRTREEDDDNSMGARLTLGHRLGPFALRWSAQTQQSTHEQIDTAFPSGLAGPDLRFRENLTSLGVEGDIRLGSTIKATLGAGYDHASYPLTGDKPAHPSASAPAISAALRWQASEQLVVTVSGGRRTRFAAMRELFSEALGRFLPNADLKPETSTLADLEIAWTSDKLKLSINPFFIRSDDTITQRVVRVGSASLRQRVNIAGSAAYGVDASLVAPISGNLRFELSGTALSASADARTTAFRRLVQRPSYEATAALDYYTAGGTDVRAEIRRTGSAVDLDANGALASLPASTEFNVRGSISVARFKGGTLAFTFAGDNLTNAVVLPQLGLPLAGRTVRIGIRFSGN